jgi:hypothetical protein
MILNRCVCIIMLWTRLSSRTSTHFLGLMICLINSIVHLSSLRSNLDRDRISRRYKNVTFWRLPSSFWGMLCTSTWWCLLDWLILPTYYMDLMNNDFMEYLNKFIIESINNILVYSSSKEEHLCLVLQKLQNHRPYVKLSKCEFWMQQVSLLSHVISKEGISVDSNKIGDVECAY